MNFGMIMTRIILTIFFIALGISVGSAQVSEPDDAQRLFSRERYTAVWKYYSDRIKKDSANADLNYKMGICYLNSRSEKASAITYFKRAIHFGNGLAPAQSYKLLADAFYSVGDYEAASKNYELYKKVIIKNDSKEPVSLGEVESRIELCRVAKELRELKGSVAVFEMNKNLNKGKNKSIVPDHSIHSSLSSIESGNSRTIIYDKDFFEVQEAATPIFDPESRKWDTSTVLMETTVGTSSDGQIILVYRNDKGEQNLYTATLNGNEWKDLEKLDRTINNKNWEPNEVISVDGKALYFSSDRPGGFGGKDIYKCTKQNNGEWSKATNMGPNINSRFDEEAPFVHPDGAALYFSSNRLRSNGYFDNFLTVFADSGSWTVPVNVGYPLYRPSKKESKDKKTQPAVERDNYIVTFNSQRKTPITVMKRIINDRYGKIPAYTEVTIANNETGEVSGVYRPDPKTGKFSCIVPSEKNNSVTYDAEGYLFYSENVSVSKGTDLYKIEKTIQLVPVEKGAKATLNNIFFEDSGSVIAPASELELNRIFKLLTAHPKAKVEISTTLEQKSNYEQIKLAGDRLIATLNFLSEKGIPKENMESRVYLKSESKKKKRKETTAIEFGKMELEILDMK